MEVFGNQINHGQAQTTLKNVEIQMFDPIILLTPNHPNKRKQLTPHFTIICVYGVLYATSTSL